MIERFAASPRGRQLASASALHREVEFLLAWPPGTTNGDGRYIRGFIDCLYQDADGALAHRRLQNQRRHAPPTSSAYAKRYEMQLYVYAMAAERALGQSPAELVLHFLRPGVEHVFPWNDAARTRAIEMVNEAIADCEFRVQAQSASDRSAPNSQP